MEYNTTRNHLVMREYGRHIQKMIEYLLQLEDKEKRQRNSMAVIELMGFLNPHLKNVEDFRHKLLDHLFLISDFKLEVASPYPIPTRETLRARPDPMGYPKRYPKSSHMGKNLELVINKALAEENPDKRNGFANAIAYYMKLAYNNWHKETVHDDAIQQELSTLTGGQLPKWKPMERGSYLASTVTSLPDCSMVSASFSRISSASFSLEAWITCLTWMRTSGVSAVRIVISPPWVTALRLPPGWTVKVLSTVRVILAETTAGTEKPSWVLEE